MADERRNAGDLPGWLTLAFPPLLLGAQLACLAWAPEVHQRWFVGELGVVELATPLLALIGAWAGVTTLRRSRALPSRWLAVWVALVTAACVYFAGEELSWGQQLVHWNTPEWVARYNDQQETNLHNVSSWFDQKPRLLLELWVLLGGIVYPLLRRHRPADGWRYWFWPTRAVTLTAVLAIAVHLPKVAKKLFDLPALPLEFRYSETQEYYFALFLALYLGSIAWRLARLEAPAQAAASAST